MPVASRGARRMGGVHLALSRPFSRFKVGQLEGGVSLEGPNEICRLVAHCAARIPVLTHFRDSVAVARAESASNMSDRPSATREIAARVKRWRASALRGRRSRTAAADARTDPPRPRSRLRRAAARRFARLRAALSLARRATGRGRTRDLGLPTFISAARSRVGDMPTHAGVDAVYTR